MTKIIKVDSCEHCPLRNAIICTHQAVDGSLINLKIKIPSWCPLEDYKGD